MVVKMNFKQMVRMKQQQAEEKAWSFIRGICFAILSYCVIYTYFFLLK